MLLSALCLIVHILKNMFNQCLFLQAQPRLDCEANENCFYYYKPKRKTTVSSFNF